MKDVDRMRLLTIANLLELQKRVMNRIVGNDLSTHVGNEAIADNVETLLTIRMRERLAVKQTK